MRTAFVERTWSFLKPADKFSEEVIRKIPAGEVVRITWSRPRNYKFHKRYFALLKAGLELQDFFDDLDTFRYWLTIKSGFFNTIITPSGDTLLRPKSISFASMDEDEFKKLYSKTIDVIIENFGVAKEDVERILEFV